MSETRNPELGQPDLDLRREFRDLLLANATDFNHDLPLLDGRMVTFFPHDPLNKAIGIDVTHFVDTPDGKKVPQADLYAVNLDDHAYVWKMLGEPDTESVVMNAAQLARRDQLDAAFEDFMKKHIDQISEGNDSDRERLFNEFMETFDLGSYDKVAIRQDIASYNKAKEVEVALGMGEVNGVELHDLVNDIKEAIKARTK